MAQTIDVRAAMQREEQRVLGKLESVGPPRAGGIVAAVTIHEMHHAGAMLWHECAFGERLREAQHPAFLDQRAGAGDLGRADMIERAPLVVVAPATPCFLGHQRRVSRRTDICATSLSCRRWSLPVVVSGSAAQISMWSGTLYLD